MIDESLMKPNKSLHNPNEVQKATPGQGDFRETRVLGHLGGPPFLAR